MHNIHSYKNAAEQYLGIIQTNSLPAEADEDEGGIFLEACRINHACDNNAQKNWNENIKRHTVHALRDISENEEITIYYLGMDKKREDRREALHAKFSFTCLCRLCSLLEIPVTCNALQDAIFPHNYYLIKNKITTKYYYMKFKN
jgi:hypothetical protein